MTRFLAIAGLLGLILAVSAPAEQPKEKAKQPGAGFKGLKPPSADAAKDFPAAKSPAEALATMKVRPGLRVELVAAEPLVMDPVDIAWGADGKLWVVEMADYPLGLDGKGQPGGRVRFLEDTNGDGQYDRSTLFLDGIPFPTGVMPWRKGVLITAAPAILYAEDTDGDGKADVRKPLFTGFGEGNQQHRVNGLRYGLDHWIYTANGDSDGQIRSTQTGQVVDIRGRDLRFRPDDGQLDAQTGRAQYGRNRDDWGNWFGCNNSNPLWHYVLDDHYLRRNPHAAPGKGGTTSPVPVQPGAAPVFPTSKTLARFNDADKSNRFTSACGAMIHRDDWFEAGNAFICEPVHNLVHRQIVEPKGVTFTSRRADDEQTSEFLTSTDNWFRPVAIHTGPDGALYVVDMYRQVIEHPQWIPLAWQEQLDLRAGHDKGRIYRIAPDDARPRPAPIRLDRLDTAGLVEALDSSNGWQRDTAQQLLIWKADRAAEATLRKLLTCPRPLARLHALCTLDGLGALTNDDLRQACKDPHPGVRRHAIRLSEPRLAEMGPALLPLVDDADPQVQLQLAYTLGGWRDPRAGRALATLAVKHQADPYLLTAVFSSIDPDNVSTILTGVLADARADGPLRERLFRLSAALGDEKVLGQVLDAVCTPTAGRYEAWQFAAQAGVLEALEAKPALRDRVLTAATRQRIDQQFGAARALAVADTSMEEHRLAAIRLLAVSREVKDLDILAALLTPRQSPAVQDAALAALALLRLDAVPQRLLAEFSTFSPRLRGQAINVLLSREAWTKQLLAHLEQGKVAASQLDAAARQRLLQHRDEALRRQAAKLLAVAGNPDRKKILEQFQVVLTMKGDVEKGKAAFRQRCAACHQLEGFGHVVGPNLTALTDKSPQAMLTAIIDPNAAVEDKFLDYVATTTDGRILTGMLADETGTSITLKAGEGKDQVILRNQVDDLRSSGKSLMPEGMEKDLTAEQIADVIAYIQATVGDAAKKR